jgi:hypothetical protein
MHSASSHFAQTPIPDAPLQTDSGDDPIQQPSTHSCSKFNTLIALAKGCACPDGYNSFGELVAIGVDDFAAKVESFMSSYLPPADVSPINHCIQPFVPENPSEPVQDRFLFELVLSGKLRREYIPQSFLGQIVYVGVRTVLTTFSELLQPGVGVMFSIRHLEMGSRSQCPLLNTPHSRRASTCFPVFPCRSRGNAGRGNSLRAFEGWSYSHLC